MLPSHTPKQHTRTHEHYMAAVHLFNGESEAMVAEMYDFAHQLEREVVFLRTQLQDLQSTTPAREQPGLFARLLHVIRLAYS